MEKKSIKIVIIKIQSFETNFIFFLNKDEKFLRKRGIVKIYHNFKISILDLWLAILILIIIYQL